jgi:hypothetical protein
MIPLSEKASVPGELAKATCALPQRSGRSSE